MRCTIHTYAVERIIRCRCIGCTTNQEHNCCVRIIGVTCYHAAGHRLLGQRVGHALGGEDGVCQHVAEGAPCKDIDDVEASGVVGLEHKAVVERLLITNLTTSTIPGLLRKFVASLKVGGAVLHGQPSLVIGPALEGQEDKPPQGQGGKGAATHDHVDLCRQ